MQGSVWSVINITFHYYPGSSWQILSQSKTMTFPRTLHRSWIFPAVSDTLLLNLITNDCFSQSSPHLNFFKNNLAYRTTVIIGLMVGVLMHRGTLSVGMKYLVHLPEVSLFLNRLRCHMSTKFPLKGPNHSFLTLLKWLLVTSGRFRLRLP